ncbi:MAG: glycosyltransferase family 2 protein [Synechococcus sp.]
MTLASLQEHLLRQPGDAEAWSRLQAAAAMETQPTITAAIAPPVEPLVLHPLAGGEQLDAGFRPLRQRFHPVGSGAHQALRERQLQGLVAAVAAGSLKGVMQTLGPELVHGLAERLSPADRLALGEAAHRQGRHDLAAPLLQANLDLDDDHRDLRLWSLYFLAEEQRLDGAWETAEASLQNLLEQVRSGGPDDLLGPAFTGLAWLRLGQGDRAGAVAAVDELRQRPGAADNADTDLLGRVTSTLDWLDHAPRQELPHARDLAAEAGLVAAIDQVQLSPCGALLRIEGWIVDPGCQLQELCLIRGDRVERLDLNQVSASARPDLAEVLQRCGAGADHHPGLQLSRIHLGEALKPPAPGESAELFLVLRNGEQFCLRRPLAVAPLNTPQLKQVLDGAISDRCELQLPLVLQRVREVWSQQLARRLDKAAEHRRHGEGPTQPQLSVVVPLYGRIDFMEFQLNWFHAWRRRLGEAALPLQLIYVLDDPRLKEPFEALVKRCRSLYGMPFETVVNPENMGYAGANNRGAAVATAPLLLLLNSDVLPAHDHSLASMVQVLESQGDRIGALGARLLFDNGGLQHGGMEFVREPDLDGDLAKVWLNEHPLKGVNVSYTAEQRTELPEVEAATAACLMLRRDRFEALGGFSTVFVVGDFEDSDLCLRLRQQGLGIHVDRAAVFYHLERQSVGFGDADDRLKMKVVAANAFTHHQRWCSSIELLKSSGVANP